MKIGDVIFEQGIYKIKFAEVLPESEIRKGFRFHLLKKDEFFKSYAVSTGYPYNYDLMKSTVINLFKQVIKNDIININPVHT